MGIFDNYYICYNCEVVWAKFNICWLCGKAGEELHHEPVWSKSARWNPKRAAVQVEGVTIKCAELNEEMMSCP